MNFKDEQCLTLCHFKNPITKTIQLSAVAVTEKQVNTHMTTRAAVDEKCKASYGSNALLQFLLSSPSVTLLCDPSVGLL